MPKALNLVLRFSVHRYPFPVLYILNSQSIIHTAAF